MVLWTPFTKTAALSMVAGALLLSGCGENDGDTTENIPALRSVGIQFEAVIGDEALTCSDENNNSRSYAGVGTTSETISIKDFRFFVSEIKMVASDGTKVPLILENNSYQYQDASGSHVALLDFEDNTGGCVNSGNSPATYTTVVGKVPAGEYTSLQFTVGVPFGLNHVEFPDVEALNHAKMSWNWAAGRKFTKLEAQSESNTSLVWRFHLGSTGCEDTDSDGITNECGQPNRVTIAYGHFDPATETVKIDYQALLSDNDVSQDLGVSSGCMSKLNDPECEGIMGRLGIDVKAADGMSNYDMEAVPNVFSKGVRN
jgi:uncharacterized repeat protein (TIGR04052 family)